MRPTPKPRQPVGGPVPPGAPPFCAVAIAASTGGPGALERVLRRLPRTLPAAVFVVQHMPPRFTQVLAQRLDQVCPMTVLEASSDQAVRPGQVYIAPGDYHMRVGWAAPAGAAGAAGAVAAAGAAGAGAAMARPVLGIRLDQGPPVNHVRPSADVLMQSVAAVFGARTLAVVLTGMGRDGADGVATVRRAGGSSVVQDPATSVVDSMPMSVVRAGNADLVLPVEQIAEAIVGWTYDCLAIGRGKGR